MGSCDTVVTMETTDECGLSMDMRLAVNRFNWYHQTVLDGEGKTLRSPESDSESGD